jgi:ribonuclease HI
MQNILTIYTDGGCSGNPGPGGWAFVVLRDEQQVAQRSGSDVQTTNNRMELTAVTEALKYVQSLEEQVEAVHIHTDSQYVQQGITRWIIGWKKNGWKTAAKAPVKNQEYWKALDAIAQQLPVKWHWVKGHAGIEHNELCDALVRQEMDAIKA